MPMPLSLVSCTKSVMEELSFLMFELYTLFAETLPESITIEAMRSR
jgi:hypothetical protein